MAKIELFAWRESDVAEAYVEVSEVDDPATLRAIFEAVGAALQFGGTVRAAGPGEMEALRENTRSIIESARAGCGRAN